MGNIKASPAPGPTYWIFYPALIMAVGFLFLSFQSEQQSVAFLWAFVALVPTLGGIILRSNGQQIAASVCAVIVLACYWAPVFLLTYTLLVKRALGAVLLIYLVFVVVPIGGLAFAATRSFSRAMDRRWATAAVILGTVPSIAIALSAFYHVATKHTH